MWADFYYIIDTTTENFSVFSDNILHPAAVAIEATRKILVSNVSKDTVYLMAGEIVKGGKQDRIIAENTLIYPETANMEVEVYCIEEKRWRIENSISDFEKYYNMGSMEVRKSLQEDKNQEKLWEIVNKTFEKKQCP